MFQMPRNKNQCPRDKIAICSLTKTHKSIFKKSQKKDIKNKKTPKKVLIYVLQK